jgi:hypothetical protein
VLHSQRPRLPVLGTKIAWVGNAAIQLAVDGEPILPGHFYLAPGGHNMRLERGRLRVLASPKEHLSYPSINALFRTAAVTYGPRVVGVILSGALNGGTAGLWEIKRRGGLAIVQVPVGAAAVGQRAASAATGAPFRAGDDAHRGGRGRSAGRYGTWSGKPVGLLFRSMSALGTPAIPAPSPCKCGVYSATHAPSSTLPYSTSHCIPHNLDPLLLAPHDQAAFLGVTGCSRISAASS